jgi:hypothetical protein
MSLPVNDANWQLAERSRPVAEWFILALILLTAISIWIPPPP